jgi:hypothetical protein
MRLQAHEKPAFLRRNPQKPRLIVTACDQNTPGLQWVTASPAAFGWVCTNGQNSQTHIGKSVKHLYVCSF